VVANNLKNVTGTVNQGIPIITQLVSGLQTAASGLTALKTGLTTLSTAVQDPTTGLPGLNNARPKFATIVSNAVAGATPGISTTQTPHVTTGIYVVDFGSDVSKRALVVSMLPTATATAPLGQAVDCATPGAGCPAADTSANHVLVTTEQHGAAGTGAAALADSNFTILAISG
jgi:X-X-X-Leu-X-X-Gly heptad repeat protein